MNVAACAAGVACTATLAVGMAGGLPGQGPEQAHYAPASIEVTAAAASGAACDPAEDLNCQTATTAADKVMVLPPPSGDPKKDFSTLQAALDNKDYNIIDGESGGRRQVYAIDGMLEVSRSLTLRNLEIKQVDNDYVVRTLYGAGRGTKMTLRLENLKIERGPANSSSSGSVSDSAGIWITDITPEFKNIEVYGGGKGHGIHVINATGGYLTDIHVHDITWTPYPEDYNNPEFWQNYNLAYIKESKNWNGFTIHDYDGRGALVKKRIEEQVNGITLNNARDLKVIRPRVARLMTKFSDGQLYPYQTDGIVVVSGDNVSFRGANVSNVSEGFDVPGFPASAIEISGAVVSDAPLFCYKTRGSYDERGVGATDAAKHVTISNSTGMRCGMAAYVVGAGAEAWLQDTVAIDTGLGPGGTTSPGFGTVAAYRFMRSQALPTLDGQSTAMGLHILNPTIANPKSKYMETAFHSENNPNDRRTYAVARDYAIMNPTSPNVQVAQNFTVVENSAIKNADANHE